MKMLRFVFILAALVSLLSPACLAVNGSFDNGLSEITRGMAGSGAALPQDSLVGALDPAGMVFVGNRVDAGAAFYFPDMNLQASSGTPGFGRIILPQGQYQNLVDVLALPDFGINYMINPKSSFGISLVSLGGFGTTYETGASANVNGTPMPGLTGAGTVRDIFREGELVFSYAHTITPTSSWGLSLLLAGQTFKLQGFSNLAAFTAAFNQGLPVNALSDNGTDDSYGVGVRAGVMAKFFHRLNVAVSYQPTIGMSRFQGYADLFPDGGKLNIPANGVIGTALEIKKGLFVTADVTEVWYDQVPGYSNTDAALLDGTCSAANPAACLGGANGASFGWRNMTAWKFGVQWHALPTWTFRAGYEHSSAVVRSNQIIENIIAPGAIIQNLWSLGFTKDVNKKNQLTMFFVYVPTQILSGTNAFSGGTQTLRLSSSGMGGGLSWTWLFA